MNFVYAAAKTHDSKFWFVVNKHAFYVDFVQKRGIFS